MLKFLLLVNKQGQARMTQYYEQIDKEERPTFESDVIKKCLSRDEKQVIVLTNFIEINI